MRGISVAKFKAHPIVTLYNNAITAENYPLEAIDTKPHTKIKFHSNARKSFKEINVEKFLKDLETQGSPDNRYNASGVNFNSGYLFALDSFVFGLRQHIGAPPIQESIKKIDQQLVESFNFYNPWFSTSEVDLETLPNKDFNLKLSGAVTTLDKLTGMHPPYGSNYALEWLNKKMKLPSKKKTERT